MSKKLLAALACGTLLTLAACGSSEEASSDEVKTKEKVTEEVKKEEKKEAPKESSKGSRSNPVTFNESATFEDIIHHSDSSKFEEFKANVEVSILEVKRGDEAYQILKAENPYNEPAPEGKEWALIKVKGKVVDAETADHPYAFFDSNFQVVSSTGKVYNNDQSAVVPDELFEELYSGGEGEGYISQVVDIGDDFKIQYEVSGGKKVFFNSK